MLQGNRHLFDGRDHNNAAHWQKDKLASGIVKEDLDIFYGKLNIC